MLQPQEIDDILERFRDWLVTANEELDSDDVESLAERLMQGGAEPSANGSVGLLQVVETMTALRHDVKLQSKGVRALREATEVAVEGLHRASEQLHASQRDATQAAERAVRPLVEKLITLDELIEQASRSLENAKFAPVDEEKPVLREFEATLEARFASMPRWQQIASTHCQRIVRNALREYRQREEASTLDSAAKSGIDDVVEGLRLLRSRAATALSDAGIERIVCVGRRADPESMRVVEVVDGSGEPPETVVDEVRPGYRYQGKIVRSAEVRAVRGDPH